MHITSRDFDWNKKIVYRQILEDNHHCPRPNTRSYRGLFSRRGSQRDLIANLFLIIHCNVSESHRSHSLTKRINALHEQYLLHTLLLQLYSSSLLNYHYEREIRECCAAPTCDCAPWPLPPAKRVELLVCRVDAHHRCHLRLHEFAVKEKLGAAFRLPKTAAVRQRRFCRVLRSCQLYSNRNESIALVTHAPRSGEGPVRSGEERASLSRREPL